MLKFLTLNCRQWSRDTKRSLPTYWRRRANAIADLISRENPDIILFQELTFPMTLFIPKEYKRATGLSISHHIYCRKQYKVKEHEWHLHWCRAKIYTNSDIINVFSVHSHWDKKIYKQVAKNLTKEFYSSPVLNIAGGDWNVEPKEMERFLRPMTLRRSGLITFENWTNPESRGELDYFATLAYKKKYEVKKLHDFVSDHYPVIMEVTE